jgi:hypothetical protein
MPPKRKKRAFEGELQAQWLARWLNENPIAPEQLRIQHLIFEISQFLQITRAEREKGNVPFKADFQNPLGAGGDAKEATEGLEDRLLRYWRSTRIAVRWPPARRAKIVDVSFQIAWLEGSEVSEKETTAFLNVLTLTRGGSLYKLRQCDNCPRWMFVKFPHGARSQKQCSKRCIREARKWYMRDKQRLYRKIAKEKDARAKAAVGYRRK